jgi:hypothetical protein
MTLPFGKPVILSPAEGWDAEDLKPVRLTWARCNWVFWVFENTALYGWNTAFFDKGSAEILVAEGALYRDPDESGEDIEERYDSLGDIKSVVTVDGDELYYAWFHFDDCEDAEYCNPADNPVSARSLADNYGCAETSPGDLVEREALVPEMLPGLGPRDRAVWKVKNLLTDEERVALFGDRLGYMPFWING